MAGEPHTRAIMAAVVLASFSSASFWAAAAAVSARACACAYQHVCRVTGAWDSGRREGRRWGEGLPNAAGEEPCTGWLGKGAGVGGASCVWWICPVPAQMVGDAVRYAARRRKRKDTDGPRAGAHLRPYSPRTRRRRAPCGAGLMTNECVLSAGSVGMRGRQHDGKRIDCAAERQFELHQRPPTAVTCTPLLPSPRHARCSASHSTLGSRKAYVVEVHGQEATVSHKRRHTAVEGGPERRVSSCTLCSYSRQPVPVTSPC